MQNSSSKSLFAAVAILLVLGAMTAAYAQIISDFVAVGDGRGVHLQWTTSNESGVAEFRIQRSFDKRQFHTIRQIAAFGSPHTYSYTDSDLFKSNMQVYYYRIEIAGAGDRVSYSTTQEVSLNFSSIRRTWGSIKAMFR